MKKRDLNIKKKIGEKNEREGKVYRVNNAVKRSTTSKLLEKNAKIVQPSEEYKFVKEIKNITKQSEQ